MHGPIAAAAAPVPTAVAAPVAKKPAPAPVEFYQNIEIFERGITRQLEVKVRVDCVPVRYWLPGGMAYDELYKGMQVDPKLFDDFYVHIITIMEGPCQGDAFILAQGLYRIAKGLAVTRQVIEKTEHCTKAGVEKIVGPNIVLMLKYSTHTQVSDRTNLTWFKCSTSYFWY